jgi:hypothetical protein
MSVRTSCKLLVVCSVLLCASVAMAQAPSTIFELDGTAGPASGTNPDANCTYGGVSNQPCDYWNLINTPATSGSLRGHSSINSFVLGSASTNAFTGGHSKDALPISGWAYTSTNTPPKDGLNAGYAAAYSVSDFDIIFGADRFEGSGDANIGIWFFQNSVSLNGTGGFTGNHANGDVFIVSQFVNGGGVPQIAAYTWDQPGLPNTITSNDGQVGCSKASSNNPGVKDCASANLLVLVATTTSNCTSGNFTCAISNTGTVSANWASYNSPSGTITSPFFFSGGIDITKAFAGVGGTVPCFASFLEETRSSAQISAVLKDFLLGGFPVCGMSIAKTCGTATVNSDGTSITYPVSGTVTNTGIGTLTNVTVFDTPGTSGGVAVSPSTLTAGQVGTWSDSATSTASSLSDSAFATATASGTTIQSTNTATASCSLDVNTTLTVSKSCKTTLVVNNSTVQVQVAYGGSVCNTGPSKVTGISLEDYPDSSSAGGSGSQVRSGITLGPGTTANPTCASYGSGTVGDPVLTYNPTLIDQTVVGGDGIAGDGAGRYFFSDLITIPTAVPSLGTLTVVTGNPDPRVNGTFGFATASCPICQGSGECTP